MCESTALQQAFYIYILVQCDGKWTSNSIQFIYLVHFYSLHKICIEFVRAEDTTLISRLSVTPTLPELIQCVE